MVVKKTKRGQKELDLKTIIPHVEYEQAGEQLQFNLVLPCGSGEAPNYNPALLLGYLQQQYNIPPWLCSVLRTKLYTKTTKNFVNLPKNPCKICQGMLLYLSVSAAEPSAG